MRATLVLTLCAVCLLPASAADSSSPHHDQSDACPSSRVAADCKACSDGQPGDGEDYISRCCNHVESYSTCRDQLDAKAKVMVKRSIHQLDDDEDFLEDKRRTPFLEQDKFRTPFMENKHRISFQDKRRTPFLGKRANPFLGKRRVNPFLGKRRSHAPFLGKRTAYSLEDIYPEKRHMPFLG